MSEFVIRVQQHEPRKPRHTYTEGRVHRDTKGRFASMGATAMTAAGLGAAGSGLHIAGATQHVVRTADRRADKVAHDFIDAAKLGEKEIADKLARRLKEWDAERPLLIKDRNRYAAIAGAGLALGTAGMYAHGKLHQRIGRNEVAKSLRQRAGQKLDNLHITGEQARNAGVMGQIGGGAGVLAGAGIGAGIGAAAKHPAQGAGIGAAIGGALGGSAGAGAGLYAGRPSNAARRRKKLVGTAPTTLAKAFDGQKRGAVIGAGAGVAAGQVIGVGARGAAQHARTEQGLTDHLADWKAAGAKAKMLDGTGDFHRSPKGVAVMAAGGALTGAALVRRHQRKIAAQVEAPIAKMSDDTKTKLARGGLIGAQLADVAAIKSAYHETTTARKVGTGLGSSLSYGAKKAALPIVAGGLVASIGAERVMHGQQKKLKAAQALKTPTPGQVQRSTNP